MAPSSAICALPAISMPVSPALRPISTVWSKVRMGAITWTASNGAGLNLRVIVGA